MERDVFSPLRMEWDGERYQLTDDLVYLHNGAPIIVPAGFRTDLDSVPRLPFAYWLLKGRSKRPAIVHDWLFYSQSGRAYADGVFLDAMADTGVPMWQRYPIYLAVRSFGGWSYARYGSAA